MQAEDSLKTHPGPGRLQYLGRAQGNALAREPVRRNRLLKPSMRVLI
jgi:hypothetical protein